MSGTSTEVQVHVDLNGVTTRAGTAFFHWRGDTVSTTFTYERSWLADTAAFELDPTLPLVDGSHHTDQLPGAFADSAPDRWGRNLITRRARAEARQSAGAAPNLSEVDFLLGVSDFTRQGALRFRIEDSESFLAPDNEVPKLKALPQLLRAAESVTRASPQSDDYEAVKVLLDAGTGSLGGARPKATVQDAGARLIAKFPHHRDEWDISAWEKTALDLAEDAGIEAPVRRLLPIGPGSVLLLERFDRRRPATRVPYISAMTLMSETDGATADYVDLAAQLEESAAGDTAELNRLFRRVAFSVAIHNTDDHLRNTGFLRARDGWRLSPVFDVNPNPDPGARRQTTVAGADTIADEGDGLLDLAEWCRLDAAGARVVIGEVASAVSRWRQVAQRNGLSPTAINDFNDSFDATLTSLHRVGSASRAVGSTSTTPAPPGQDRHPPGTPRGGQFRGAKSDTRDSK